MKVLVVRLSSMGDVIHTLPALTDAIKNIPSLEIDWVVDKAFAQIPNWHYGVRQVFPVDIRSLKKDGLLRSISSIISTIKTIRKIKYDLIIDPQGLIKSMLIAKSARGKSIGLSKHSIKEKLASYGYNKTVSVSKVQHAIARSRELFAKALKYQINNSKSTIDYGIDCSKLTSNNMNIGLGPYLVFLHGTTWKSKHWPDKHWETLSSIASSSGFKVVMVHANSEQKERVSAISSSVNNVIDMGAVTINDAAHIINDALGIVTVDTGFGHLASALNKPIVSIYGPTSTRLTGILSAGHTYEFSSRRNCAPCLKRNCMFLPKSSNSSSCMEDVSPTLVWKELISLIDNKSARKIS